MPPIKRFRPFLLIVWLGRATHQAFSAVFAYRLARAGHSSSIFGRFCLSSGSVMPPIKRFRAFLLIVWLGRATHQAFSAVFAYRLARASPLFTDGSKSGSYGEKENGQTVDFDNLSALAPPVGLEPTTL